MRLCCAADAQGDYAPLGRKSTAATPGAVPRATPGATPGTTPGDGAARVSRDDRSSDGDLEEGGSSTRGNPNTLPLPHPYPTPILTLTRTRTLAPALTLTL